MLFDSYEHLVSILLTLSSLFSSILVHRYLIRWFKSFLADIFQLVRGKMTQWTWYSHMIWWIAGKTINVLEYVKVILICRSSCWITLDPSSNKTFRNLLETVPVCGGIYFFSLCTFMNRQLIWHYRFWVSQLWMSIIQRNYPL